MRALSWPPHRQRVQSIAVRLFQDIKSKWLLHAKGWLFLLLGLIAIAGILLESPHFKTVALLLIAIWAFCRFYYYLFYVLEHYAGRGRKYAGLLDSLKYIFCAGDSLKNPPHNSPNP